MSIKNRKNFWYVVKRFGEIGVALSEDVHLVGLNENKERIEENEYCVFIPLIELAWNSTPPPEAIRRIGNYGIAIINVVRKIERHYNERHGQRSHLPRNQTHSTAFPSIEELDEYV